MNIFSQLTKFLRLIKPEKTSALYLHSRHGENVINLNETTLTGRMINYLHKGTENPQSNLIELKNYVRKKGNLLAHDLEFNDLRTFIPLLGDFEYKNNQFKFQKLLQILDLECCNRLEKLNINEIYDLLHAFLKTIPNKIVSIQYYEYAIDLLFKRLDYLDRDEIIQLIFFIGLLKNQKKAKSMIRTSMKNLNTNSFNLEELCIISNSLFKTSTKLNSELFLSNVIDFLNNNLCTFNDSAYFITLVKVIRQNHFQNSEFLHTLVCVMFFNNTIKYYNFPAMCHVLALFSDCLFFDENLLKEFTNKCLNELESSKFISKRAHPGEQLRGKDIHRFLWCLSNLNYKLEKSKITEVLIPKIIERIKGGEFEKEPGLLVEIVLYLWMLNFRAYDIVPYVITKENYNFLQEKKTASKGRFDLLLSLIYFEDKDLHNKLKLQQKSKNIYNVEAQIRNRPTLTRIFETLKLISTKHRINKFELSCQIPYLNIIGITGYQKKIYKSLHIEVLDDFTCLKNTNCLPGGLMSTKLRILDRLDEGLIIVEQNEIEDLTEFELEEYLLDAIEIVC